MNDLIKNDYIQIEKFQKYLNNWYFRDMLLYGHEYDNVLNKKPYLLPFMPLDRIELITRL